MINKFRNLIFLLILYMVLLVAGLLLIRSGYFSMPIDRYASLLTIMTIITGGVYFLVSLSVKKDDKEKGMFLLAGIGGKFLAYLIMILIFWMPAKNLTKEFIIAFFVLYLLLTFFLISILLKMLKTN